LGWVSMGEQSNGASIPDFPGSPVSRIDLRKTPGRR